MTRSFGYRPNENKKSTATTQIPITIRFKTTAASWNGSEE